MSQVVFLTVEPSSCVDTVFKTHPSWIHPHLTQDIDLVKGRQLRVSALIPKGTCLLIDRPYAIIPVVDNPPENDDLTCSNPACNQRVTRHTERCPCPNACIRDVRWCSSSCREADSVRHGFECTWLKRYSESIRAKWGEYDFGMLWVIVRLLATRQGESQHSKSISESELALKGWKSGWDSISLLCGSSDTWSHERVRSWTVLVKKYLQNSPILPHGLSTDQVLHLICQEEANSFGLYPKETGHFPVPESASPRGEQFAAAVYSTAAMANHSCAPNIVHKPNDQGYMVFTASRDMHPGEECCISYFDLTQHTDLTSRREHLQRSFRFVCRCERCLSDEKLEKIEEPEQSSSEWTAMPMMDIL
ncbi:hypothetical protein N7493_007044 [Penicillium malachiteum]|uniref:SET domain-containing protein n=1 Tax=Penicillium malachiteum TaxID=1324776 RepID=A0AAD6HKI0_9EURO|nr:hypothetical protein N7493_007044 [Penicillium malachiteum]